MATETAGTAERATGPSGRLQPEDRVALLRYMLLMRATEERALTLYRQGKVPGSYYDGRGQEAVSVGTAFALARATARASCTATSARTSSAASSPAACSPR